MGHASNVFISAAILAMIAILYMHFQRRSKLGVPEMYENDMAKYGDMDAALGYPERNLTDADPNAQVLSPERLPSDVPGPQPGIVTPVPGYPEADANDLPVPIDDPATQGAGGVGLDPSEMSGGMDDGMDAIEPFAGEEFVPF